METILFVGFAALLLPGIAMAMVPALPALLYLFAMAALYALIGGFHVVTLGELGILGAIAVVSAAIDYSAGMLGAKYGGASKKSILWGFVGLIIGSIVFFPFGGIAGLAVGVLIAELVQKKPHDKALKAAAGSVAGAAVGVAVNVVLASIFFALFIIFAW